jgi:hypothetical protein
MSQEAQPATPQAFYSKSSKLPGMPKFTFEITPKQRKLMDRHPDVNWSQVFRSTIEQESRRQELARRIEMELTDKDVEEMAALVNNELRRRWLEEFGPGRD